MLRFTACLLVLLCFTQVAAPGQSRPGPHKPALDLFVYRRSHTSDEPVKVRLSGFNQKRVEFTAFRLNLPALIPNSRALEEFGKRIKAVDVSKLHVAKSWSFGMGVTYPDQWAEREVYAPRLAPGVYLIRAKGGGAEKRTWLSVSDIALLSKRSRQEILVFAASAHSGQPKPGIRLTMTDAQGRQQEGTTDEQGVWRVSRQDNEKGKQANVWLYGEQGGHPAFLLAGAPSPPEPYTVYMYTDRPVYRPGHIIQFKGTVRERLESDAPGGFNYRPYADKEVTVEIRDATDALVKRRQVRTNAYGSFEGSFQLAGEPTLGRWQLIAILGEHRSYANMEVQAYRKPEYSVSVSTPAAHFTGGGTVPVTIEGRYYFGQPVANAVVSYNIQFVPEPGSGPMEKPAEPPFTGQGVLDSQGQLKLEIKTQRLPHNRRLTVTATVTDLSRRSQAATGGALITAGRFRLFVSPERAVYHPGDRVNILVRAEDYDDKPVAAKVRVQLIETKQDNRHRLYKETTTRELVTDSAGKGTAQFTPPRPGYLEAVAEAFDPDDNKIAAQTYVWVAGEDVEGYDYPDLDLLPDRPAYRPGEVAAVLLNTSLVTPKGKERSKKRPAPVKGEIVRPTYPTAWALVLLEGERLYSHRVVRLTGRSTVLRIPLEAKHFPSVRLSVVILQERQIYEQDLRLAVEQDQPKLSVTLATDREKYAPGQEAVYTVSTRDYLGRPVPAEVGLGVVDASIYAIQPDNAPDPVGFFYGGQEVRVQTDFSFAAQYSGGAAQTVPAPATPPTGQEGAGIRVRRQFADTAVWRPFVVTGADGMATLRFTMPDNLTTWRATARGLTLATAVGTTTKDVVATMPLLVRLSLPRFYVDGDQAVVSAIVHNYTADTRSVHAHIETSGAVLQGDADRTFTLAPNAEERLDWRAQIGRASLSAGAAVQPARFLITADGGPGGQDATELTLPVSQDGLKQVDVTADSLAKTTGETRLDLSKVPSNAVIRVSLSPSLAAATFEALDYLTSYPYGCAEQTMSSFLPDVIVSRALKRLNIAHKSQPDLEKWVNLGLQKLYRYQHPDGGWNWWEFDQTDGDMTAYVLWGLVQAKEAGYLVDDQRILRGTEVLLRMLSREREWNRRADWILSLAAARPQAVTTIGKGEATSPLDGVFANRDKLDTLGLASLCLSLARVGGNHAAEAVVAAHELEAKAAAQGTTVHWPAADGGYTWRSDDAGVTAHVLRALLAAAPQSPLITKAIRWLMGNRVGKAWQSTRSSAEAIYALADYMQQNGELQPHFSAEALLDDSSRQKAAWTPEKAFEAPVVMVFSPDQWRGHKTLTIKKQGEGVLYSTTTITYAIPSAETKAGGKGVAVRRFYRLTAEDPSHADTIASGQDVEVTVEVTADANYRYAILEEPIPAGCEPAPPDEMLRPQGLVFENGSGYVRQEVHDNKVVFFFDELPKGRATFLYRLHAETPGVYRILPSLVSLVYFPEIRGNSAPVQAKVGER